LDAGAPVPVHSGPDALDNPPADLLWHTAALYDDLARGTGKAAIVDRLLERAETRMQIPTLLALTEKQNPARYEHHGPYYNGIDFRVARALSR
jgi:hypothetical protein